MPASHSSTWLMQQLCGGMLLQQAAFCHGAHEAATSATKLMADSREGMNLPAGWLHVANVLLAKAHPLASLYISYAGSHQGTGSLMLSSLLS